MTNNAVTVGMVSGIRNLTKNTSFNSIINNKFIKSIDSTNLMLISTIAVEKLKKFFIVEKGA